MEANLQAPAHGGTFRPWAPHRSVVAAPAPAPARHAGAHRADRGRHRGRAHRLAGPRPLGDARRRWPRGRGRAGARRPSRPHRSARPVRAPAGVTKTSINVVFPVVAVNSLAGKLGFAEDKEYNEQIPAINLYVDQINQAGGINGRKINPIIVQFDPTNDANMQALCEQWTQGSPGVFAVVDGIGTWEGDDQLCVTQQGHTPLISAWSTISDWTAPRLALPVVDRARHGSRARCHRAVGPELGPPRPRRQGGRRGLRPGGRPGGAQPVPPARPQEGGHHPARRDGGGQPRRDGRHQLRRAAGRGEVRGGRRPVGLPAAARRTPSSPTSERSRRRSTTPSSC